MGYHRPMPSRADTLARRLVAELARVTGNRPMQYRMLSAIAAVLKFTDEQALAAAAQAEQQGWLLVEDGHSLCLTEAGRQLARSS
jgi:hypothetical protein